MKKHLNIGIILISFLAGCSTTPKVDDPKVIHNACYSYTYGENGFDKDYEKAFLWCTLGAKIGIPSSQTLLAELYFEGNGTPKDLKKAATWYKQAAEQGHPHAQLMYFLVTNIYGAKESTDQEKADGFSYLKKSMDQNYTKAIDAYQEIYGKKI